MQTTYQYGSLRLHIPIDLFTIAFRVIENDVEGKVDIIRKIAGVSLGDQLDKLPEGYTDISSGCDDCVGEMACGVARHEANVSFRIVEEDGSYTFRPCIGALISEITSVPRVQA